MDEYTKAAFFEELDMIHKEAGIGSFVGKGFASLGKTVKGLAGRGQKGGVSAAFKGHGGNIKGLYQAGAKAPNKAGKASGMWGGVKRVAQSPYGQMAAAGGVTGLAGYGGFKGVSG